MMNTGLTLTQTETLPNFLLSQAAKRHEKNKHVLYTFFPDIREMDCMVYWGVFSWSIPGEHERWLKKSSVINIGSFTSTPGDIVRDYLSYYHPKKLRAIAAEMSGYNSQPSAALFVHPSIIREGSYVDITSTYFSIVKTVGWNVGYKVGSWLIPGRSPYDFTLPENKAARNYLVSIGLKTPMLIWTGKRMISKHVYNIHTNRALWLVVQDILHSIARKAISLGAIYVHTDGYILPTKNVHKLNAYILAWGLVPRVIAEGEAMVCGFGNYQVGEKHTKVFDPSRFSGDFDNIRDIKSEWLMHAVGTIRDHDLPHRLYLQSLSW